MTIEERCPIDGYPLVKVDPVKGEPREKCLNEQVTHTFYWPDKWRNTGWTLVREQTK